jgi:hypothetical protein
LIPITTTSTTNGKSQQLNVSIANKERTWERFYAKIITSPSTKNASPNNHYHYELEPITGMLAPRGGANNACDANQPYSDAATIAVTIHPLPNHQGITDLDPTSNDTWLVASTEEQTWCWKLIHL